MTHYRSPGPFVAERAGCLILGAAIAVVAVLGGVVWWVWR